MEQRLNLGGAGTSASLKTEKDMLQLVQAGVERFILKNATVEEFLRTIQEVTDKETSYSHQLTRSVFARIVKAAVRKRNRSR